MSELVDELLLLPVILIWLLFPLLLLFWLIVLAWGQTPGKLFVGIVAVRRDGTPFSWAACPSVNSSDLFSGASPSALDSSSTQVYRC
ncbi:RDD family protein [Candidatus Poriferisodalis sp.]|uniref:RDD family protein n=1 Tax=Candidatus Poriferisodalis sp. TaxID=3101277 RepID=UPI003AF89F16